MNDFQQIHQKIVEKQEPLNLWLEKHRSVLDLPVYTSVDVRDAGFKIASVDANVYPAGFNNICEVDRENGASVAERYLTHYYGDKAKKILLITEEHTNNAYYWQNVYALTEILKNSGREVCIAFPSPIDPMEVTTANGQKLSVFGSKNTGDGELELNCDFQPDLILSNNDFSQSLEDWGTNLKLPLNPPRELGWYQRKKSQHFEFYNQFAKEFAEILDLDYRSFQVKTQLYENFDVANDSDREALAHQVEIFLKDIQAYYDEVGIKSKPVAFIKNNAGTYGLAVNQVADAKEIIDWNYKNRKKMKAAKGGNKVQNLIIQEGIPSRVRSEGATAEPVIYLMGCSLLGGFLRTHNEKGENESLNSPGAVYRRLCVTDLLINSESSPLENVYGWIAKLSSLAIGKEMELLGVKLK